MRVARLLGPLLLVLAGGAEGQVPPVATPAPAPPAAETPVPAQATPQPTRAPIEAIPDPVAFTPSEVLWVNPLFAGADLPAKLVEKPSLPDFESKEALLIAVRLEETGRVVEGIAVEPPLKAFGPMVAQLAPRWTFKPARKDGQNVKTWGTFGLDLAVEVEDATLASFTLAPIGASDPAPVVGPEPSSETWIVRYPKEPDPKEAGVVSVEDVDFLPMPDRVTWKAESPRLKAHLSALVEVSARGQVRRLLPIGTGNEALVVRWLRRSSQAWKIAPAQKGGAPIDSWATLDATVEFSLGSAKETGRRSVRKNLRGVPRP